MDGQQVSDNCGVLVVDLEGVSLSDEECDLLKHPAIAGVLFFARNIQDRRQLAKLIADIRSIRSDLLLMVDQEGGRVQRFKEGFTRLPAPRSYLHYFRHDPQGAQSLVKEAGWLMASELLSCDIDLSLAPVVDLDLGLTTIVGDRAFGTDVDTVIRLTSFWLEGVNEAGMSTVCKHFPGHGSVNEDSHQALPVDRRSFKEIEARDLQPFNAMIAQGVQGVMPAHILFPEVDNEPAGFSSVWLTSILKGQLGFNGLVISDCLTMEGAASVGGYTARVEKALAAGCDLLLLSNRAGVNEVLPNIDWQLNRSDRLSTLKHHADVSFDSVQSTRRYLQCRDRLDYLSQRFPNRIVGCE